MPAVLIVLLCWFLLSVPVALVVGRVARGPRDHVPGHGVRH